MPDQGKIAGSGTNVVFLSLLSGYSGVTNIPPGEEVRNREVRGPPFPSRYLHTRQEEEGGAKDERDTL